MKILTRIEWGPEFDDGSGERRKAGWVPMPENALVFDEGDEPKLEVKRGENVAEINLRRQKDNALLVRFSVYAHDLMDDDPKLVYSDMPRIDRVEE